MLAHLKFRKSAKSNYMSPLLKAKSFEGSAQFFPLLLDSVIWKSASKQKTKSFYFPSPFPFSLNLLYL